MKKFAVIAAALTLAACASTGPMDSGKAAPEAAAPDYDTLVKQADEAIKKASSVGAEWRDSRAFLKQAEEAKAAGDMDKAIKLAKKAKTEGELAAKQGAANAKAGPWLF